MRRSLTALAVTTAVLLAPSAASAEVLVGYDQKQDVKFIVFPEGQDDGNYEIVSAPQRSIGDIQQTRISHRDPYVRVSVRYRDLPAPTSGERRHGLRIGTGRTAITVNLIATPNNRQGEKGAIRGGPGTLEPQQVRCKGLYTRIDYAENLWITQVPSSCLYDPAWVRVATTTQAFVGNRMFYDHGFSDGGKWNGDYLSERVSATP